MPKNETKTPAGFFDGTTSKVGEMYKTAQDSFEQSKAKSKIDGTVSKTKDFLDEKGVTKKLASVAKTADEHLDVLSGQKILKQVEETLLLQEKYNDILATKLDEAISKIAELEERVGLVEKKR